MRLSEHRGGGTGRVLPLASRRREGVETFNSFPDTRPPEKLRAKKVQAAPATAEIASNCVCENVQLQTT